MEGFYTLLVTWVWLRSCPASRQVARGCESFAVGRRMSEVFPEGRGFLQQIVRGLSGGPRHLCRSRRFDRNDRLPVPVGVDQNGKKGSGSWARPPPSEHFLFLVISGYTMLD